MHSKRKNQMGNPHALVIPYPAQGHVMPIMELSQWLANHGIKITFANTECNHRRLMSAVASKGAIGSQIHLVSVSLGLESPENVEPEKHLEAIFRFLPGKVEELIDNINAVDGDKITCVRGDTFLDGP